MAYYDQFEDPEYSLMMMGKNNKRPKLFAKKRRLKFTGFQTTYDVNSAMMASIGSTTSTTTTTTLNSTNDDKDNEDMLKKTDRGLYCTRCCTQFTPNKTNINLTSTACKLCERKKTLALDAFSISEKNEKKKLRNSTDRSCWPHHSFKCNKWLILSVVVMFIVIGSGTTYWLTTTNHRLARYNQSEVMNAIQNDQHQVTDMNEDLGVVENKSRLVGDGDGAGVGLKSNEQPRVGSTATNNAASLPSDYPGDSPSSSDSTSSTTFTLSPSSTVSFATTTNDDNKNLKTNSTIINVDMEFVTPLKNSPPLHVYDKIYDETRNITLPLNPASRNVDVPANENVDVEEDQPTQASIVHSGHFRDNTAEVFDPHPKYVINATNRKIVLELTQDMNFRPPHLRVVSVSNNVSRKHDDQNPACYYTGTVRGDRNSHVGVSLCNGMVGYIKTSHGDYQITPDEDYDPIKHRKTSIRHKLTKLQKDQSENTLVDIDDVISNPNPEFEALPDPEKQRYLIRSTRSISRLNMDEYEGDIVNHPYYYEHSGVDDNENTRSSTVTTAEQDQPYYIATMVVTDRKMSEYHKNEDDLTRYILTLMSHAALLFKDATVGNPIALVVVDIVILNNTDFTAPSSPEILRKFCEYQSKHSHKKHDVALLLTRDVICKNASVEVCTTLGVAEVGSMCNPSSSCAVVRDKGLSTSFTIAHELGHVLSMPHDDDRKCNKIYNGTIPNYIMARSLHHETQPWHWSQCSKHYLTEFLNSPRSLCLHDVPHEDHMRDNPLRPRDSLLPGEAFQADQQCELEFGPGSRICSFMPKCSSLWCTHEFDTQPGDSGCKTQYMPWADGTPCGRNMWCLQGQCTSKNHFRPVHGGWGKLIPQGNCTRSCGGGIQLSVRECNNPIPAHGGSYCMGRSHHYESCNTHKCPRHTPDFREQQCAQFNGNSKGLHGLDHTVRWVPKYGTNREDACKLYCRVDLSSSYYLLELKVLDGTKCGLNSFDICVNGVCRRGGCDNRLDSNVTLDDCGVCGGNNKDCCKIEGSYNNTNYGYHQVIQIPKGSSNIVINQTALNGDSDENYLALRELPETWSSNPYHLNGNSVISGYTKDIIYGGLTFKYSGSNNTFESIITPPKAKLTKDIIVEVLQVGNVTYPNINWTYTIACKDSPNYSWEYYKDKWSPCDAVCRGYRYPSKKCKDLVKKVVVDSSFCENQPSDKRKECNTHCDLDWRVSHKGPCSNTCGPGIRNLTHECIEIDASTKEQRVREAKHCNGIAPPVDIERCEGPCENIRWEYDEWSLCTKTCGGGYQERRAYCTNNEYRLDDDYCSGQEKHVKQSCSEQPCPTWIYTNWSGCSVTCGVGVQRRQAFCRIGNQIFPDHYCPHPKPLIEETGCNEAQCFNPVWRYGAWNECSGDCSFSKQGRLVTCTDRETNDIIPDSHCDNINLVKPNDTQSCLLSKCVQYKWVPSDWGVCSRSCGEGLQSRKVVCKKTVNINSYQFFDVKDEYCLGIPGKPLNTKTCILRECPDYQNLFRHNIRHSQSKSLNQSGQNSPWVYYWEAQKDKTSRCSTACGVGFRNRTVSCKARSPDGETYTFADANCKNVRHKPKTTIVCKRYECSHAWIEGPWSPCSASCNLGVRRREITCNIVQRYPQLHFIPTSSSKCAMVGKPQHEEECFDMGCSDQYRWKKSEWQKCKSMCKDERQFRRVYCVNRANKRVQNVYCDSLRNKPRRRRRCGNRVCSEASSCKELKMLTRQWTNNDYWLRIRGKRAKIYCYKMDTNEPEEFITLLDGESNYSEVQIQNGVAQYGRCPNSRYQEVQRTKFWKLRLFIQNMTIGVDDFTHSRSQQNNKISLGTAADCLGHFGHNCIQGKFKIDLTGTSFRLASNNWIAYGQNPRKIIKSVNNTISGQCGGSCGGCKVNPHNGLKVEIT